MTVELDYRQYLSAGVKGNLNAIMPWAWRNKGADAVPLNLGFPFPDSFPIRSITAACAAVMEREGPLAMQYGGGPAAAALRDYLVARSKAKGLYTYPADVVITSGSGHALDLICRAFVDAGELLAVEAPTYMGALVNLRNYTTNFLPIPIDSDGLRVDLLADALAARRRGRLPLPKLLYTIPNYHNPGGVTMPLARRKALLALADEYDFLIAEDDAYGALGFGDPPPPSLRSMDAAGRVIYLSTLSKLVGPGVRIGWAVAHPEIIRRMGQVKTDGTNPFACSVVAEYLRTNDLDQHVEWLRAEYRARCTALLDSLERHMPAGCTWTRPQGGFFIWLTFPESVDATAAREQVTADEVAYIPGPFFHTDGSGRNCARLSFSFASPGEMDRGARALAGLAAAAVR